MAVVNLIPIRSGLSLSDGGTLRLALTDRDAAAESLQAGRWMEHYLGPDAPGNWPAAVVHGMEAAFAAAPKATGEQIEPARLAGSLLYLHYVDRGEWVEATHVITAAADLPRSVKPSGHERPSDLTDALHAIHLARRGRNPRAARSALRLIDPTSSTARNSLYIGAQAAIALLEGEPLAARGLAAEAKQLLKRTVQTVGVDRLEGSWWDEVIAAASTAAPQPRPVTPLPSRPAAATPIPAPIALPVVVRDDLFAWDPGVPSDLRTIWIRRVSPIELSA
jgi:hypothetical protein